MAFLVVDLMVKWQRIDRVTEGKDAAAYGFKTISGPHAGVGFLQIELQTGLRNIGKMSG